jgi:hypothetical protein
MDVRSSKLTPYCHISLPYITKSVINANPEEVNPHPHITSCVNMWSVTFFFFFFFFFFSCHLLNVGAYVNHIAREGQVEWTTLV